MLDALDMLQIDRKIQYVLFGMKMNTHMRLRLQCRYIVPTLPRVAGYNWWGLPPSIDKMWVVHFALLDWYDKSIFRDNLQSDHHSMKQPLLFGKHSEMWTGALLGMGQTAESLVEHLHLALRASRDRAVLPWWAISQLIINDSVHQNKIVSLSTDFDLTVASWGHVNLRIIYY